MGYAELHCLSNFSFLRGASHPEELVERAVALGYAALALTDECSVAGLVRAHVAARGTGLALIAGTELRLEDGLRCVLLAADRPGYGRMCRLITHGRRAAPKGRYRLSRADLAEACGDPAAQGLLALWLPSARPVAEEGAWLASTFQSRCRIAVELLTSGGDRRRLELLERLGRDLGLPLVAAGDVHMHVRSRRVLQDVLTATRLRTTVERAGHALHPNGERHLRPLARLEAVYPPALLAETLAIAARCRFSLEELRYEYPREIVPDGETPTSWLATLTRRGERRRWPGGTPPAVAALIEHELALIAELRYEAYFLTVHDVVEYARSRGILCQGRGSAANSAVCYCLGITEVDPARMSLLFERFISRERNEPPDIDVDFEHERREEVIQYLYQKYGRSRAALTAVAISYRPKSAIRDVGKALGIDPETIDALARNHSWWDGMGVMPERIAELGLSLDDLAIRQLVQLTGQLIHLPRHLSQHPGGFVLTKGPLSRMVPIENAAMPERTVIQWDKDDIDVLGLLKVDVLALGMLTAIRKGLDLIGMRKGHAFAMQDIPAEDQTTYDMICQADTVGVFQIESRAQMSMLPRLRPRCFYDLVIEVAIVRPGPIQGGMVHPYLNRRQGKEPVSYPSRALEQALGRTLGVPVFQEQVMQVAMLAAGFTAGEADQLRRAMAAWKRKGGLQQYYSRIVDGMTSRGYERAFAEAIFEQIKGFSEYGFPESHAASFALLVYASCWIKCHHPAEFLAAMINSQPLGFYSRSQLVQDAKRHGVEVRRVDVMHSDWDCTLEGLPHPPAVRLGLRLVSGLKLESGQRIVNARCHAPFDSAEDLARRARLEQHEMTQLASADALMSLAGHRRQQVWEAAGLKSAPRLLREAPVDEEPLELPAAGEGEEVVWDYAATGLTLRRHPLAILRPKLAAMGWRTAAQLHDLPTGRLARACGIVTVRQQPETAKGVMFVSLEDETGSVQLIVWPKVKARFRLPLLRSRLMAVKGSWQREGDVRNLIAAHVEDLTPLLGGLVTETREFR